MASHRMKSLLSDLRRVVLIQDRFAGDDAHLLQAFFQEGDELALEALLRRHGPMVMGVCRRVLQNTHDAEDAFQATFLVLVRKGNSLHKLHLLSNWLYGVAYRCALQIRTANLRRRANERQVVVMPEPAVEIDQVGNELRSLLDRELERLPEKYRVALVLCDLEGQGRRETARQLGLAEGTLSSRLATGRRLLAKRLSRRGLTLSGGLLAALLAEGAEAAVPATLAQATYHAALKLSAGQALASLGVSTGVVAAFKGVVQTMLLTKLKIMMSIVLAIGMVGGLLSSALSAGGLPTGGEVPRANHAAAASKADVFADHLQSRSWTLKALDVERGTITICDRPKKVSGGLTLVLGNQNGVIKPPDQKGAVLEGLQLAQEAKVLIDGRAAQLADLKVGMTLLLKIAKGKTQIAAIQAVTPGKEDQYFVEAVDLKKNTITVRVNHTTAELPLAKDAKLVVEMMLPGVNQPQSVEGPVTEIARGTPVHMQMGVEGERLVIRSLKVSQ